MLELFQYSFFINAVLAGILSAVACGIIGTFIVVRKISFISGSIAHASFGGIGIAYFLGMSPIIGAVIFSVLSVLTIGTITKKEKRHEDAIIGAVWAIGMAVGLIFIYLTPGYAGDLFSYLFGNILLVSKDEILFMIGLDIFVLLAIILVFNRLVAIIFDEEFAEVTNIKVFRYYLFLLLLIGLTVVLLIKTVGIILVIALLTLPPAAAQLISKDIKKIIGLAIIFALLSNLAGIFLSFYLNAPSGPIIIFIAAILYLVIWFIHKYVLRGCRAD